MICEFLHPIFDALDAGFGFHGFGLCGELQTGRENKKDRLTMPKFCTALNKEKRFRYPPNLRIGITKGKSKHMRKSCCYCKSQIRYCQEVGNIQILRRTKQRKGSEKRNNFNAADRTPTVLRHNQWLVGDVTNSICSSQRIIYKTFFQSLRNP